MAAAKKVLEIELPHTRDTKGTHVFATTATGAKVTNCYVQKGTFDGDVAPDKIILQVLVP